MQLDDPRLPPRFWAKVVPEPNTGCWLWAGATTRHGYGSIGIPTGNRRSRTMLAHRFAFEAARPGQAGGRPVCHHCDTPACVNPEHLYAGAQAENVRDRDRRGRTARQKGEDGPRAKVTEALVREMRTLHATGRFTFDDLGGRFGLSRAQASKIVNRRSWGHVD